jgi:hypothetical protein
MINATYQPMKNPQREDFCPATDPCHLTNTQKQENFGLLLLIDKPSPN